MKIAIAAVLNLITFILFGIDKYKAVHKKYRIKESLLITMSFLFSSIGAMLGMIVFNHKTSKAKFRFFVPLSFVVNIICFYLINH